MFKEKSQRKQFQPQSPLTLQSLRSQGLGKTFKGLDVEVVYTSGPNIQSLVNKTKNKVGQTKGLTIYELTCKGYN